MKKEESKLNFKAMYRRWAYMVIAIAASAFLFTRPIFNFQEDKGIIYIRSFTMTEKEFVVTQTELANGAKHTTATMSVMGLYVCNKVMLYGSILCLLCFFKNRWRIWLCNLTIAASGVYYILMIYYATQMSDAHYATLSPNLMCLVPAVVLEMMVLTRLNVIKTDIESTDRDLEDENQAPD